jgi:nucleoside-diphosphate-sugar epimerase
MGALVPVWQTRDGADGTLAWDILRSPVPKLPAINGVVVLAGVTYGTVQDLALNTSLAQAGADLGRRLGVPVLVASTQAVYGAQHGLLNESSACNPTSSYGRAKLAMEQAIAAPHVTCLRIGNVAGCDALAAAIESGLVILDQFPDGQGPRRSMIGPRDLEQVISALLAAPIRPAILNVARPGVLGMDAVLNAAGVDFDRREAPPGALPELALDVTLLQGICPLPAVDAFAMAVQGGLR